MLKMKFLHNGVGVAIYDVVYDAQVLELGTLPLELASQMLVLIPISWFLFVDFLSVLEALYMIYREN